MKKLGLEDLVVESFDTAPAVLWRGTVRAHGTDELSGCATCPNGTAWANTCNQMQESCAATGCVTSCNCVSAGCTDLTNTRRERGTHCNPVECPPGEQ